MQYNWHVKTAKKLDRGFFVRVCSDDEEWFTNSSFWCTDGLDSECLDTAIFPGIKDVNIESSVPQDVKISLFVDDISLDSRPYEFCKVAKIRGSYALEFEPIQINSTNSEIVIQITAEPRMLPPGLVIPVAIFFGFLILCMGPVKFCINSKCCS